MSDTNTPSNKHNTQDAPDKPESNDAQAKAQADLVREVLQSAVMAEVDSREKAEEVLDTLEAAAAGKTAGDAAQTTPTPASTADAAQQVQAVSQSAPAGQKAAAAVEETARVLTASSEQERKAISEAAQEAFNPQQKGTPDGAKIETDPSESRPRSYLREAVLNRLMPLDALDAKLFLRINHLPHTPWLNRMFHYLTTLFTSGAAWYGLMGLIWLHNKPMGERAIRNTALPLILSSSLIEFPIKSYCRRKRPFIAIVQAIVIGKKPGTWSFPSGHSAVAFGGAWLLGRLFPRQRGLLYAVAGLVGFSRIYLGDHYPGDVLTGSVLGMVFAELIRRLLRKL